MNIRPAVVRWRDGDGGCLYRSFKGHAGDIRKRRSERKRSRLLALSFCLPLCLVFALVSLTSLHFSLISSVLRSASPLSVLSAAFSFPFAIITVIFALTRSDYTRPPLAITFYFKSTQPPDLPSFRLLFGSTVVIKMFPGS